MFGRETNASLEPSGDQSMSNQSHSVDGTSRSADPCPSQDSQYASRYTGWRRRKTSPTAQATCRSGTSRCSRPRRTTSYDRDTEQPVTDVLRIRCGEAIPAGRPFASRVGFGRHDRQRAIAHPRCGGTRLYSDERFLGGTCRLRAVNTSAARTKIRACADYSREQHTGGAEPSPAPGAPARFLDQRVGLRPRIARIARRGSRRRHRSGRAGSRGHSHRSGSSMKLL